MKTLKLFIVPILLFLGTQIFSQNGYEIRVKIEGYTSDTLLLGYNYGSKTYVASTATLHEKDGSGYFVFKGDTALNNGMYMVVTKPNNDFWYFVLPSDNEQKFSISTKLEDNDYYKNLKITGSAENTVFTDYIKYNTEKNTLIFELKKKLETVSEEKASEIEVEINKLENEIKNNENSIIKKYPKYFVSKLIPATRTPDFPDHIKDKDNTVKFYYYRDHFWDGIDFADNRLFYTPFMEQRIETYLEQLTVQNPDSVIKSAEFIMNKVINGKNKDVYKFTLIHLLNKYAASKTVCMDNVYYYLGSKYYCGNTKPDWIEESQLEKICENVKALNNVQCGAYAPHIALTDIITKNKIQLYGLKAKYTVVYFWDNEDKNAVEQLKDLQKIYTKYKRDDLEILGVCKAEINNIEGSKNIVKNNNIGFANVSDFNTALNVVKELYNVKVYPSLFLLDEHKKIVYKKIDIKKLEELLKSLLK